MFPLPELPDGWMTNGACHQSNQTGDEDPRPWFFSPKTSDQTRAKKLCDTCPVWTVCLEWSLDPQGLPQGTHLTGIYAGLTETDRPTLRRLRQDHRYRPGCLCAYCRAVDAAMSGRKDRNRNGPGARHGYRSTKSRGCDCTPCRFAAAIAFQRAKSA